MFRSQVTDQLKYQEVIVKVLAKVPKTLYRKARKGNRREIQDFFFSLQRPSSPPTYQFISDRYQRYVRKQKRGATYLFISKNMVTKPCPKKNLLPTVLYRSCWFGRYQLQVPVRTNQTGVLVTVTMPCPDAQNCYQ